MICPSCGAPNHADFSFCLQCGQSLTPSNQDAEQFAATRAEMPLPTEAGTMAMEPLPSTVVPPTANVGPEPLVRLRVDSGSVDEDIISLERPLTVIGRRQGSDIVIHDTNVSRMHAQIKRDGQRLIIEDTNSSNGTIVNDERIERPRELRSGDVIRIGDAVFVFETETAPASLPADDLHAPEGSTMAIDLDSPMTSLGGAPELMLPSLAPRPVTPPSTPIPPAAPLTPPPAIMDGGHTSFAEGGLYDMRDEEDELTAAPQRGVAPPPPAAPAVPVPVPVPQPQPQPIMSNISSGSTARASVQTSGGSTTAALESLRRELTEVGQELGAFSGTLSGLADRVDRLERSLDAATGDLASVADAIRGPDATVLKELHGIVEDIERAHEGPQLDEAMKVLELLAAQPRDIELLLKLSQQAGAIESALRIHGRLVAAAPRLRTTLARLTG